MKTSFKYLLVASMLAIGFTSCSKDDKVGPEGENGEKSELTVVLQNPTKYAISDNATDKETNISSIDIFIFNTVGIFQEHKRIDTPTPESNGTYKATIEAPVGNIIIHAGLNLPVAYADTIKDKGVLAILTVRPPADKVATDDAFFIFNTQGEPYTVVSYQGSGTTPNQATIDVARFAAKVNVEEKSGLGKDDISAANFFKLRYAMGQVNTKVTPTQDKDLVSGLIKDPNWTGEIELVTYPGGAQERNVKYWDDFYNEFRPSRNTSDAIVQSAFVEVGDANWKYATENTSSTKYRGELTYACVQAEFLPTKIAAWDGSNLTLTDNTLTTHPGAGTAGAQSIPDYHLVQTASSEFYYFESQAQATAFATATSGASYTGCYEQGLCYYYVILNTDANVSEAAKGNTFRNNFYRVSVNNILSIGNPGPEITKPDEKLDDYSDLEITITILDWTVIRQGSDLQQ